MMCLVETIRTAAQTGSGEITAGRVTMRGRAPDAALQVRASDHEPLGEHEPVCELVLTGENLEADIGLTATGLDTLVDAFDDIREGAPSDE